MATNLDDIAAIQTHFLNAWVPLNPSVPYFYAHDEAEDEPQGIWARLIVTPGAQRRRSIFERKYEQLGRIYLHVVIPSGTEPEDYWPVVDSFVATFQDWRSEDWRILCDVADLRPYEDAEGTYMIEVSIPYTAQH